MAQFALVASPVMSRPDYSRRLALIAASSVLALASTFIAAAAASAYRRGCRTVGLTGQRMMTTAGVSSASTSSTVSVSTAVMAPLASSVIWTWRSGFLSRVRWISQARRELHLLAGRYIAVTRC
jgi:hypothetical protein